MAKAPGKNPDFSLVNLAKALESQIESEKSATENSFQSFLLDNLLMHIPAAIFFKDLDGKYIRVSREFLKKLQLRLEEDVLGKKNSDFFAEPSSNEVERDDEFVLHSGTSIHGKENLELLKDGREIWSKLSKFPLKTTSGKVLGTLGIAFDVSDMRKMELDLRMLLDNLPDNIYFKDSEGKYTRINKTMSNLLGLDTPEQAIGLGDSAFFSPAICDTLSQLESKVLSMGLPQIAVDEQIETKSGRKIWLSFTILPIWNHQGQISGIFGLSRDISRLKDVEKKLQEANTLLEEKVKERTSQLSKANLGMEIRLQQLKFLNHKAHFFSQIVDLESLYSVIFFAFVERYSDSLIQLWSYGENGFKGVHQSTELKDLDVQSGCLEALRYLDAQNDSGLYYEKNWHENILLKNLFPSDLNSYPGYVVLPLSVENRLRGAIQMFTHSSFEKIFNREEMVLNTLGVQAAIAMDSASHYQKLRDNSRIESQLEIAKKIQQHFIPRGSNIPGFELTGICRSANAVGGDYLDFFQNEKGDWVLVIADVCGKGIPAALMMTSLRSTLRAEARKLSSSKAILAAVNMLLKDDLQADNSFITSLCMVMDKEGKKMNFSRAGHPGLLRLEKGKGKFEVLAPRGIALGMVDTPQFLKIQEEQSLELHSGDCFLAHTDGLDEAMNHEKKTYGMDRLIKLLNKNKKSSAEELVDLIIKDVRDFSEGYPQFDDLTLFSLAKK